ncbi:vWA domain-containing protein [Archangium primigenium]|uniref:vWA domain-containing protein n=1 Tax=[Archangium] primigenium TaxID=2792470 RepID=UPI00195F1627|nr:VWA domain-containing protein [Archangium primigenium]MBM7114917.1 VWA domain-containing protein [Archangium primigenium]
MTELPGGPIATRPLHFIFIADCSGSMAGGKIQSLNQAVREALPHMQDVAKGNPNARVLVRVVRFASGAQWHVSQPTPVEEFSWTDLSADGSTDMGLALKLVTEALKTPPMSERALPPVLVLLSDGSPTDDFNSGLKDLMAQGWGKKAVRIAIAIGEDANLDVLQRFMGHPELRPLVAQTARDLVKFIRWASTAVLQSASAPASQARLNPNVNVPLPAPPAPSPTPPDANDVW